MKKIGFFVFFLLVAAALFAFDPGELNIMRFYNNTGYDIHYIFLSPGDSDFWGPEVLGAERILPADENLGFFVHYPDAANTFDIMAIDDDGYTFILYDYEIRDGEEAEIVFQFEDLIEDPPDMQFVTLHVENNTVPIYLLFISPEDSNMWGADLLDEETILDTTDTFRCLVPVSETTDTYNVMAVDEDLDEYMFDVHLNSRYADEEGNIFVSVEVDDLSM